MKTNVALAMGSSLHHESYEMALEIYVLFTSNYTQVARIFEIAMVHVIGSIEDKRCFKNLNFINPNFATN